MRVRLSTAVLASVFCAGVLVWSPTGSAQNLGRGRGQLIENGPVDVAQLAQRATLIIHGVVASEAPTWIGRVIYTQYEVLVQETLKGAPRNSVLVAVVGGGLGNVLLTVPGAPDLQMGDQLILFAVPLEGESSFTPVGTFSGIVRIRAGGSNSQATVAPRGNPEALEAFLQEIRTLSSQP